MHPSSPTVTPIGQGPSDLPVISLFDLNIVAADLNQATQLLLTAARQRNGSASVVVTPNVDHVVRLEKQPEFKAAYAKADFIFADGMPLVWFSRLMQRALPARVTGSDLFVQLCLRAVPEKLKVALIGGQPGQEQHLQDLFQQYYPGLDLHVRCPSMKFDPFGPEGLATRDWVQALNADIIFICLGMPKQERWALHYARDLPGGVILCVGAAMEFAVGLQKRAPAWVQRIGMEWVWRLLSNPRHLWRRYLVEDPKFLLLCWRAWKQR
ncbi:WecB/TagA/CpsF family glycosyltransferase [Kerstersia sp.]|uniref:WecB/TagA/CpsF family glycosyltransferase n=1 Tax=Kerstersia sp. TaxID=1930783 RepID=UPI003F92B9A6